MVLSMYIYIKTEHTLVSIAPCLQRLNKICCRSVCFIASVQKHIHLANAKCEIHIRITYM